MRRGILAVLLFSLVLGCGGGGSISPVTAPSVSVSASPETIEAGQSSTLTWSSTGAIRVEISGLPDASSPSGVLVVSPAETTTYTVTAFGPEGLAAVTQVTVTVIQITLPPIPPPPPPPPPAVYSVSITASWDLPTLYSDGTAILPEDQALIVVTVFMKSDAGGFLETDIPIATSTPGAVSVTFGPVDVTQGVTYYFSARASVGGQISVFAPTQTHIWP